MIGFLERRGRRLLEHAPGNARGGGGGGGEGIRERQGTPAAATTCRQVRVDEGHLHEGPVPSRFLFHRPRQFTGAPERLGVCLESGLIIGRGNCCPSWPFQRCGQRNCLSSNGQWKIVRLCSIGLIGTVSRYGERIFFERVFFFFFFVFARRRIKQGYCINCNKNF